MTESVLRLGAEVRVINHEYSLYNQTGRYLGASEIQGLQNMHRICFDGKVVLIEKNNFRELDE